MAWLTGWNYRKAITITNTGSALTDYQVSITVDTASLITALKMRSDCGDIRFTDSDGSTLRYYWIESGCNTVSTKIWVKTSIPSGTKTIYIYYNNPIAVSASNGNNTFDFFDHFLGTSLDTAKWTFSSFQSTVYGNGSISVSNSIATFNGGASTWWGLFASGAAATSVPFVIEYYMKISTGTNAGVYTGAANAGTINPSPSDAMFIASDTNAYFTQHNYVGSGGGTSPSLSSYTKIRMDVYSGNVKFYVNDSLMYTSTSNIPTIPMKAWIAVAQTTGVAYIDWVFIRKYASTGPTSSISGTEELPIGYLDISSTPTDADIYTDSTFRGRTPSLLSLPIGSYNLKVSKTGYIDYTETIIITEGFTLIRSVTLISLSNITATNVTLDHVTPCIEGTCVVTANVTWTNSGTGSGNFVPNIKIDNIAQTPVYPSQSLAPGASVTKSFPIIGLPIGTHTICPYPN